MVGVRDADLHTIRWCYALLPFTSIGMSFHANSDTASTEHGDIVFKKFVIFSYSCKHRWSVVRRFRQGVRESVPHDVGNDELSAYKKNGRSSHPHTKLAESSTQS